MSCGSTIGKHFAYFQIPCSDNILYVYLDKTCPFQQSHQMNFYRIPEMILINNIYENRE